MSRGTKEVHWSTIGAVAAAQRPAESVAEMQRLAVERQRLDRAMRGLEHRSARRLVDAARLHPDVAVLDEVEAADAVAPGEPVESREEIRRREALAVHRDRIASLV